MKVRILFYKSLLGKNEGIIYIAHILFAKLVVEPA